eukprot:405177-Hanusia_phi.AAC.3
MTYLSPGSPPTRLLARASPGQPGPMIRLRRIVSHRLSGDETFGSEGSEWNNMVRFGTRAATAMGMAACLIFITMIVMPYHNTDTLISQTHGDGSTLKRIIKRTLIEDSEMDEGHLYANALRKAGFRFNHGEEDAIATSLQHSEHRPSSLAISPKLQQQIQVADVINQSPSVLHKNQISKDTAHKSEVKTTSLGHHNRVDQVLSDKIRLAEAILHGNTRKTLDDSATQSTLKASKKAIQASMIAARRGVELHVNMSPLSIKQRMKEVLNRKAEKDLQTLWSNSLSSKSRRTSGPSTPRGSFAESFLKKLNDKEARMYKEEVSAALSKEELMTPKWDSAKKWESNHPGAADAQDSQSTALLFGNVNDGTQLRVKDGHSMSRMNLEKSMRLQLDAGLHNLQRSMRGPDPSDTSSSTTSSTSSSRKRAITGTHLIQSIAEDDSQVSENKLEKKLKDTISGIDHDLEEKLYHASLAKNFFTHEN